MAYEWRLRVECSYECIDPLNLSLWSDCHFQWTASLSQEDCALLVTSKHYRQIRQCSMSLISAISMWAIMQLLMSNLWGRLAGAYRCSAAILIAISWFVCNSDFLYLSVMKQHWTFVLDCCIVQNLDLWSGTVHHTIKERMKKEIVIKVVKIKCQVLKCVRGWCWTNWTILEHQSERENSFGRSKLSIYF